MWRFQGGKWPTYIAWVVDNAQRFEGVELAASGETDEALAASLVEATLSADLAARG